MMKKISLSLFTVLLAVIMLGCILCGCGNLAETSAEIQKIREENPEEIHGFIQVYANEKNTLFFYREPRTDVMYALYRDKVGYAGMAGLTVMWNADGTPLLYSEWVEMEAS